MKDGLWLMFTFLCCITQPVIRILLPVINMNELNDRIIRAYGCWVVVCTFLSLLFTPMFHMKIFFVARFLQKLFARYFIFDLFTNMSITWSFDDKLEMSYLGFSVSNTVIYSG